MFWFLNRLQLLLRMATLVVEMIIGPPSFLREY